MVPTTSAVAERGWLQGVAGGAVGRVVDPAVDDAIFAALRAGFDDRIDAGPTYSLTIFHSASDETCFATYQAGFTPIRALFTNRLCCSFETAFSFVAAHLAMVVFLGAAARKTYCHFASGKPARGFLCANGAKAGPDVCSAYAAYWPIKRSCGNEAVVTAQ